MEYAGSEKRKCPRVGCHFLVTYRSLAGNEEKSDTSQLKNISLGGMLFTTAESFGPGANLALKIRLPLAHNPIMPTGKVIESRQIVPGLVYNTRLEFSSMNEYDRQILSETLGNYSKLAK